jgi:hypothetical protein
VLVVWDRPWSDCLGDAIVLMIILVPVTEACG